MSKPATRYLKDYTPPVYKIESLDLKFALHEDHAMVSSSMRVNKNSEAKGDFILNGVNLELIKLLLDGQELKADEYFLTKNKLTFCNLKTPCTISIKTKIQPQNNTSLDGLYRSNNMFCTQCEAQGFRKITFFPDRPDVMTRYTTTIEADKESYPVLLSNGNLIKSGILAENRHFKTWHDPFPKPSYLFAMVAGDLSVITGDFTTRSGRKVSLEIYVEHHNKDKCQHALQSLQKAMAWDEERFGLEYDLDQYMIVAVDDFNAGAMENKGLNIFNSKYVLAKPQTATDNDYEGIESVIAHEYFHNWTGNRITCRDWFQLCLKEGLTVFRDQEFTSDTNSRAIKRINDVNILRNHQFPEDSSPMAHPIRPESYIEINNFYTLTVYEKGAEVIRMLNVLLGPIFDKGLALYIKRHDGQAATTDEFIQAMEEALLEAGSHNGLENLKQFRLWYSQAGTPILDIETSYSETEKTFSIIVQQIPPINRKDNELMHIPLSVGLLDKNGNEIPLELLNCREYGQDSTITLHVNQAKQVFTFKDIKEKPVPSLLRGFSAPIILNYEYSENDLYFLLNNDPDHFSRWEAGQRLLINIMLKLVNDYQAKTHLNVDKKLSDVFRDILTSNKISDKSFISQLLTLPTEEYLAEQMEVVDVEAVHHVRQFLKYSLASDLHDDLLKCYTSNSDKNPYVYDPKLAGQRRLKNLCLSYLMADPSDEMISLCHGQFSESDNMTDEIAALSYLVHSGCHLSQSAITAFYDKWHEHTLVLDKWFIIQASAPLPDTLQKVINLLQHPSFSIKNPNKVRSLIGAFAGGNPICFHDSSGQGYKFLAERIIELDKLNPNIASRLTGRLSRWHRYDSKRQNMMKAELERIINQPEISKGVYEIASKSLAPQSQ